MGSRRQGREMCLQTLYLWDNCALSIEDAVEAIKTTNEQEACAPAGDQKAPALEKPKKAGEEALVFAGQLTDGILKDQTHIDHLIERYCHNWKLSRMSAVDRNILRIGAYEIIAMADIPLNVIINEAVEIAKSYSTEESGKFVNGILDKMKIERNPK